MLALPTARNCNDFSYLLTHIPKNCIIECMSSSGLFGRIAIMDEAQGARANYHEN